MLRDLIELKRSGAVAIKLEFESEYYDEKSSMMLSELTHRVGLDLCIKLGGLSSIQDLHNSKRLCVNSIVAPMVESSYGVEKFLNCVKQVYGDTLPDLYLNIETKTAFENLDEIVSVSNEIEGFVLGRSDLMKSLKIDDANSPKILEYCRQLDDICSKLNKKFIIGGKINLDSIEFMNTLPNLTNFETRKVIFDVNNLNSANIRKSLEFELKCLKSKITNFNEDKERIEFIENSLNLSLI